MGGEQTAASGRSVAPVWRSRRPRRCSSQFTFDLPSFSRARASVRRVLVGRRSNHRSYLDFLLCSFLFFDRPDLGIGIPYIAAASEFEGPAGWLFKRRGVLYQPGGGREIRHDQRIQDLADSGETLEFSSRGLKPFAALYLPNEVCCGLAARASPAPCFRSFLMIASREAPFERIAGRRKPNGYAPFIQMVGACGAQGG